MCLQFCMFICFLSVCLISGAAFESVTDEYLSAGRVGGGLNPAVWSSSYQNRVYCQRGFHIRGIRLGVLVHNNNYGTRI